MNNAVAAEIDAIHGQHIFRKIVFNRFIHPEFPLARFFVVAKKTENLNRTSEIAPFNLISIFFQKLARPYRSAKYPPKHQPTVPAVIAFPSLSFAPASTSTCTQLPVIPSIVFSAPMLSTFTVDPLPIVTTGFPAVLPLERRRRFSVAR